MYCSQRNKTVKRTAGVSKLCVYVINLVCSLKTLNFLFLFIARSVCPSASPAPQRVPRRRPEGRDEHRGGGSHQAGTQPRLGALQQPPDSAGFSSQRKWWGSEARKKFGGGVKNNCEPHLSFESLIFIYPFQHRAARVAATLTTGWTTAACPSLARTRPPSVSSRATRWTRGRGPLLDPVLHLTYTYYFQVVHGKEKCYLSMCRLGSEIKSWDS